MFAFTKTLAAIALGATVIAGVTLAATGLGGLSLSTVPVANAWQGYSNGWDNTAGWNCFSNNGRTVGLLGLGFEQSTGNGFGNMTWAGCYNSWAHPFFNAGKTQQADSFERRYAGVELPRLPVIQ